MFNGDIYKKVFGVDGWLGMWRWGLLVAMRRVWGMLFVDVLLLFVMAGVAFGWVVGSSRFASSLP